MSDARATIERLEKLRAEATPGKWEAEINEAEYGESIPITSEGSQVAQVYGGEEFPCLDDDKRDDFDTEARETALLIAAAVNALPALLECAKTLERIKLLPFQYANACDVANVAIELANKAVDRFSEAKVSEKLDPTQEALQRAYARIEILEITIREASDLLHKCWTSEGIDLLDKALAAATPKEKANGKSYLTLANANCTLSNAKLNEALCKLEKAETERDAALASAAAMRRALEKVRPYLDPTPTYGCFHGGDPREFTPDEECSTEQERANHKADCAKWDAGEVTDVPVSGWNEDGSVHVTRSAYGLGVYYYDDPETKALREVIAAALAATPAAGPTDSERLDKLERLLKSGPKNYVRIWSDEDGTVVDTTYDDREDSTLRAAIDAMKEGE